MKKSRMPGDNYDSYCDVITLRNFVSRKFTMYVMTVASVIKNESTRTL